MGQSTWSGPIKSNAGFITGTDVVLDAVTAATLALTADDHNGRIIPLSRAGGMTVTLPAATGSQARFKLRVDTTFTSSGIVQVANASDVMNGFASVGGGTAALFGTLPASDTLTMNGSTTGGLAGSIIELVDVATNKWEVVAKLVGSGTPATPFSAAV